MRKKILLYIGLCIVLALTACNGETDDLSVPESISGTSDINSDPAPKNSDQSGNLSPESSDPEQGGYVQDEAILSQISLEKNVIPDIVRMPQIKYASDNLECKELFRFRSPQFNTVIDGINITETGFVISLSYNPVTPYIPYTHYLWFDRDGKELDHVAFDLNAADVRIPDRDYPENGFFITPFQSEIRKALYFQNGTLRKAVQLPQCYRSDYSSFSSDKSQFLCIDGKQKNLILYDFKNDTAAMVLPVEKFGYDDPWRFEFVRIVTPELATVTLLEYDEKVMYEYHGVDKLRRHTYLLEFPTLNILQQLPDGSELTSLGDGNFLMTKQYDKNSRSVFRAKLENGKIVDMEETGHRFKNEPSQFHDRSNIILSPNKKVVLFRYWEDGDNDHYMTCYAASTDDMRQLWQCDVSLNTDGIDRISYMPAAITDDAVLYQFHFGYDNGEYYSVYRFGVNK